MPMTIPATRLHGNRGRKGVPPIEDVIGWCFKRRLSATRRPHEVRCECVQPEHSPDRHPSLRIDTDRQLAYCDVCAWGGDVFTFIRFWLRCSFLEAARWIDEHRASIPPAIVVAAPKVPIVRSTRHPHRMRGVSTVYCYLDANGRLLYQKLRTADKRFFYRRPRTNGGWTWGLGDIRPVLYRLPLLTGRAFVLVVEGEKDADAAWDHKLPATTNPEGAGNHKWQERYTRQLLRAGVERIYVVPDNDDVGRLHARQIVASCQNAGLPAWLVPLPGVPLHGDLSDYLADGHSRHDVLRLLKEARRAA